MRKELNRRFIVLEHQYGRRDVMLYSDLQCLPPGDPTILCSKETSLITGKSFIALSVGIWGSQMANRCIAFVTDNVALVSIVNQQTSKHKLVVILIRDLVLTALNYNHIFRARHIPGLNNTRADCLSRFQIARFKELSPQADELPTIVPKILLPKSWSLT